MERIVLDRTYMDESVTFGSMTLTWTWDGESFSKVHTLERPWIDNQPWDNESLTGSCIPFGIYPIVPVYSRRFGSILAINGVPKRSLIRVHAGNKVSHSHGCILTGLRIGSVKGEPFIFNSRDALRIVVSNVQELYDRGEQCELEVVESV